MNTRIVLSTALGMLLAVTPIVAADVVIDGFEGSTLNSFWTPDATNVYSSYSLSTDRPRTGTQSLKYTFDSTTLGGKVPKFYMTHLFSTPVQGTFSVWLYDGLAKMNGGLYVANSSNWAEVGVGYGTWGLGDYAYRVGNANTSLGQQTLGWHHLEVSVTDAGSTYRFDGATVGNTDPLTSVSTLYLATLISNDMAHPSYTVYFDDFSFTPAAVPEPMACWAGLALMAGLAMKRRRQA